MAQTQAFAEDVAAAKAVAEWIDADPARELIGCTPAMLAQVALSAARKAGIR